MSFKVYLNEAYSLSTYIYFSRDDQGALPVSASDPLIGHLPKLM